MFRKLLLLGLAGACGTLARYGLSGVVHRWMGSAFPWGTATVNILGCLLFGLVWATASERNLIGPEARLIVLTGFMGAFTTFSTFISETSQLISEAELLIALSNMAFQLITGITVFYLGLAIGRAI